MAYRKQCDSCEELLGQEDVPFIQIHGSISEQVEDREGKVEYRYITPHPNTKLAFCDIVCLGTWIEKTKKGIDFVSRF